MSPYRSPSPTECARVEPRKRPLLLAARLTAAAALALGLASFLPSSAVAARVCIDPGHGGPYSNANANGLREKNLNLAVSLALREQLRSRDIGVVMTRSTDRALTLSDIPTWNWCRTHQRYEYARDGHIRGAVPYDDLQARANVANSAGADIFVSVHANGAASSSARGTEDFASRGDPLGRELAGYVQRQVVADTGLYNRGTKAAEFYVLRWSNMPAILLESGFISNPSDARRFRSSAFRTRYARAVARGISKWLETKPFERVWPRRTSPTLTGMAAVVSAQDFPAGARQVVIVRNDRWRESMAAPVLASDRSAPLLFVTSNSVPTATATELERLKPSQVILAGVDGRFSESLRAKIASASNVPTSAIQTFSGEDARSLCATIGTSVGIDSRGEIVLAPEDDSEALLQATAYAARARTPLLMTSASARGRATNLFISANRAKIRRVIVFGSGSSISKSALTGLPSVTRIYKSDVAEWSVRPWASGRFYLKPSGTARPVVVCANRPLDRMIAANHAGKLGQPILLVNRGTLPVKSREFIGYHCASIGGFEVLDVGGSIPTTMDWCLKKADYAWRP